jgi:hypothetical protein
VSYKATAEPYRTVNYHCRDCQRPSDSGYAALCAFHEDHIKLNGAIRFHRMTSERGIAIKRRFFPTCGNPVAMRPQVAEMP